MIAFEPDDVAGIRAKKLVQQRLNANQSRVFEYLKLNPQAKDLPEKYEIVINNKNISHQRSKKICNMM